MLKPVLKSSNTRLINNNAKKPILKFNNKVYVENRKSDIRVCTSPTFDLRFN